MLGNHLVELVLPWLLFMPRDARVVGGFCQIAFQAILISSGNLSFLNWLTMLPAIWCLDDAVVAFLFPRSVQAKALSLKSDRAKRPPLSFAGTASTAGIRSNGPYLLRALFGVVLASLIVFLSIPVVQNLLSSNQAMNTSFESLRIVNTYGAFGSITKTRHEVVLQGTHDDLSQVRAPAGSQLYRTQLLTWAAYLCPLAAGVVR